MNIGNKLKYFIFLIGSLLTSCSPISEQDLVGQWNTWQGGNYPTFIFSTNELLLVDDYGFRETGRYQVKNNHLIFRSEATGRIETKILNFGRDAMILFDSLLYYHDRTVADQEKDTYRLIDIETDQKLNTQKMCQVIHFYQSLDGGRTIRAGDKIVGYEEIPFFLGGGHSNPEVLMFIGEGIQVKDLRDMYYHLALDGQKNVTLVLKKNGPNDYDIFIDHIEIWWNDLENFTKRMNGPPPPPPPVESKSRKAFLQKNGQVLTINSKEDIDKLADLKPQTRYVLLINESLSLHQYFRLKKQINSLERTGKYLIRTEFN